MSLGDFDSGAVIYGKFTTFNPSTGAPFTLAGTPALSVYKDNSTTQTTTGVTLTADFDSVTGLNHFAIDTSDSFYAVGSFFDVVITTGTVNAVSAVGSVVGRFTIRKTACLKPTTSGRTLDVDGGTAAANMTQVGGQTASASGTVTFPAATLASTTNITAGTIATVTNRVTANTDQLAGQTVTAATSVIFPAIISSLTAAGVRSELAVELGRIDTTVGSRLASASYTAPLSAAGTRAAIGLASANLDTQIAALPLASVWTSTRAGYLDSVLLAANSNRTVQVTGSQHIAADMHESQPGSIHATTFDAGAIDEAALATSAAAEIAGAVLTTAMTESYRATNAAPTLAQATFELIAHMGEASISGTTKTLKKIDGTTAKTFTLDSSTTPTSITEAT